MTTFTKRLNIALVSTVVAAALTIPAANAAERGGRGGPGHGGHERGDRVMKKFERIDANEDGLITLVEMTDPLSAKAEKKLARKDQDEDGVLSIDEMQRNRHGNAVDLSAIADEIIQCVSDIKETTENDAIMVPSADSFLSAEERFALVDTSEDGFVDLSELTASMTAKATAKHAAMDADESADVDVDEFKAASKQKKATKGAIRQCVREIVEADEE